MEQLQNLKAEGRIEEARQHGLLQLAEHPQNAELHYEVAGLHDNLGREAQAIPLYQRAIALGLAGEGAEPGSALAALIAPQDSIRRRWQPSSRVWPASRMPVSSRYFAPWFATTWGATRREWRACWRCWQRRQPLPI